jgi:hypothetical protein
MEVQTITLDAGVQWGGGYTLRLPRSSELTLFVTVSPDNLDFILYICARIL